MNMKHQIKMKGGVSFFVTENEMDVCEKIRDMFSQMSDRRDEFIKTYYRKIILYTPVTGWIVCKLDFIETKTYCASTISICGYEEVCNGMVGGYIFTACGRTTDLFIIIDGHNEVYPVIGI